MRICYLSAGAFAHVGTYLDWFQAAGHDVHFVALSPSPPRSVPVHEVGFGSARPGRGKWRYPFAMLGARRLIRRLAPDIVHAHYATSGGLAGLVCGHERTVVTAHGTDLTAAMRSAPRRALLKAVFDGAACVNTVSADLTRMAMSLGVEAPRIAELTPGIDTGRFRPAEAAAPGGGREPRLLCTRRLEPVYDPGAIVEALALLAARGFAFSMTFAGDGILRPKLEARVACLGLESRVRFLGAVGGDAMPELLRAHDVYLSASRADGTSLSLLEAMASGLVPVVSRIPANEAWLEDGVGGFLHAPGNPADLAARIEELGRRPALAASAAASNRAKVVALGDRSTNMRRLERLYAELVSTARRKRCGASMALGL